MPTASNRKQTESLFKIKSQKQCESKTEKSLMDNVRIALFAFFIWFCDMFIFQFDSITNKNHLFILLFFSYQTNSNIMMKCYNSLPVKSEFQWNYSLIIPQQIDPFSFFPLLLVYHNIKFIPMLFSRTFYFPQISWTITLILIYFYSLYVHHFN